MTTDTDAVIVGILVGLDDRLDRLAHDAAFNYASHRLMECMDRRDPPRAIIRVLLETAADLEDTIR